MANTITGPGSFSGPGNFTAVAGGGGGGYTNTVLMSTSGLQTIGIDDPSTPFNVFSFYGSTAPMTQLTQGNIVHVSGITGPNAALNGTTFEINSAVFYDGSADVAIVGFSSFATTWVSMSLGLSFDVSNDFPGMVWSWN